MKLQRSRGPASAQVRNVVLGSARRCAIVLASAVLISACKSDGSGGSADNSDVSGGNDSTVSTKETVAASDWTRGFVESFDPAKVAAIRSLAGFAANSVPIRLRIQGHPIFDTAQKVASNALAAARVDYAHSTGLSGKGQLVAMMDDGLYAAHEQFDGKKITRFGDSTGSGEHGTRVASVIAGTGKGGGALGVAPDADLLSGTLSFNSYVDFGDQAAFLQKARAAGAVAVNNSWTLDLDLSDDRPSRFLQSAEGRDYLRALRDYTNDGIVVFSMQNDYDAPAAHILAAIPLDYPDLEDSFITAVNATPVFDNERIISATRLSAGCMETARYCMTASGQIRTATYTAPDDYSMSTGSSFAAPQIAGSIALLAEAFPDLTPQQLRARLLATADNSFFSPTGKVEFADGISHGYNAEFGHGFLNLRGALLPIGDTSVPMASAGGDALALGTAAITGSALSGNAVAASLGDSSIVALDELGGVFELPGDTIAGRISTPDLTEYRLSVATGGDLAARRDSVSSGLSGITAYHAHGIGTDMLGALELSGNATQPVAVGESFLLEAVGVGEGNVGLRYRQAVDAGSGQLILGFSALHENGSVLGMTAPGYEDVVEGESYGIELTFSQLIGNGMGFIFEGEFGLAEGSGGGMVRSFESMRFDALRLAVERGDVFSRGDVLSLFASRPAGLSAGSAIMVLPVAAAGGAITFGDQGIDLTPDARQVDFGLQYAAALGNASELRLGFTASFNEGHERGKQGNSAVIGVSMVF